MCKQGIKKKWGSREGFSFYDINRLSTKRYFHVVDVFLFLNCYMPFKYNEKKRDNQIVNTIFFSLSLFMSRPCI